MSDVLKTWWQKVVAWFVADDPHPEYSWLDRMDGLGDNANREG